MTYIYQITNDVNNLIYIGQTRQTIERRWKEHLCAARNYIKNRPAPDLYADMRKYGIDKFHIEVIEECLCEELNDKEKYWIKEKHSHMTENGYNRTWGGGGYTEIDEITIFTLYSEGKDIKQIQKITGHDKDTIRNILINNGISAEERKQRGLKSTQKPVKQIDKNTLNTVAVFQSASEAYRSLGKTGWDKHIAEVCSGSRKSAYGFYWEYA